MFCVAGWVDRQILLLPIDFLHQKKDSKKLCDHLLCISILETCSTLFFRFPTTSFLLAILGIESSSMACCSSLNSSSSQSILGHFLLPISSIFSARYFFVGSFQSELLLSLLSITQIVWLCLIFSSSSWRSSQNLPEWLVKSLCQNLLMNSLLCLFLLSRVKKIMFSHFLNSLQPQLLCRRRRAQQVAGLGVLAVEREARQLVSRSLIKLSKVSKSISGLPTATFLNPLTSISFVTSLRSPKIPLLLQNNKNFPKVICSISDLILSKVALWPVFCCWLQQCLYRSKSRQRISLRLSQFLENYGSSGSQEGQGNCQGFGLGQIVWRYLGTTLVTFGISYFQSLNQTLGGILSGYKRVEILAGTLMGSMGLEISLILSTLAQSSGFRRVIWGFFFYYFLGSVGGCYFLAGAGGTLTTLGAYYLGFYSALGGWGVGFQANLPNPLLMQYRISSNKFSKSIGTFPFWFGGFLFFSALTNSLAFFSIFSQNGFISSLAPKSNANLITFLIFFVSRVSMSCSLMHYWANYLQTFSQMKLRLAQRWMSRPYLSYSMDMGVVGQQGEVVIIYMCPVKFILRFVWAGYIVQSFVFGEINDITID